METILVTGGTGYIGSHTCLGLINKGYDVCILDSLVNSSEKVVNDIKRILDSNKANDKGELFFFKGDLRNKKLVFDIFSEFKNKEKGIDAVIHFAGLKSVEESLDKPLKYWDSNVNTTLSLLEIMDDFECNSIVFSSSATIYQQQENTLIKENQSLNPKNPYGVTKLVVEKLLNDVFLSDPGNWKIANLRYFNPIGAHASGLIGEDPIFLNTNLFPQITKAALGKIKKIKIFGSDWPTSDGTAVRDYIHIMDLAEGHILALQYLKNEKPQISSFNIGTGHGTSVLELIKIFEKVNNVTVPYIFDLRRVGDNGFLVADCSLAKSLLGWTPKRSISDMCVDGWQWQVKNPKGYCS